MIKVQSEYRLLIRKMRSIPIAAAVDGEAPRHYIDLDIYPDLRFRKTATLRWDQAVEKYTEDT
jgi:hypothetical protein